MITAVVLFLMYVTTQRKAQTTVVIAHRLGTIRNADKICVISSGCIAETGTHDELYAANGLYADLFRLQMTASTEEGVSSELAVIDVVDDNLTAAGDSLTLILCHLQYYSLRGIKI